MKILNTEYNNAVLIILALTLIFLLYCLYYYSFNKRVSNSISTINYPSQLTLKNLPLCIDTPDILDQNILSDYYIASSSNTICIGNLKYDYVSIDMINTVLASGARYIEIPICSSDVSQGSPPIVATGETKGEWITSLNVLSPFEVFNAIINNAFTTHLGKINYPLFVNLKLYTTDTNTLNQLTNIIKQCLGNSLLNPTPYYGKPISLERICILLNKIIIISSDNYSQSTLNSIIVPMGGYLQRVNNSDISSFNANPASNNYTTVLSKTAQTKSSIYMTSKYPSLKSVMGKSDFLNELKTDPKITDVLTCYNQVGMTVICPNLETDIIPTNYNITNAMDYGCQFISLNFQVNDASMTTYTAMFKNSSFVLKPDGFRFNRTKAPTMNINDLVPDFVKQNIPIITDFYNTYNNTLISITGFSTSINPNNLGYITSTGENLIITKIQFSQITLNNVFVIVKSINNNLSTAIMFQSALDSSMYITLNGNYFYMTKINPLVSSDVINASFYPVASQVGIDDYVSFQTVSSSTSINGIPVFLGISNKTLSAYNKDTSISVKSAVSFKISVVPSIITVIISSINNLYMRVDKDGDLFFEDTTPTTDDFKFYIKGLDSSKPSNIVSFISVLNNKYILEQNDNIIVANGTNPNDVLNKFQYTKDGNINYIQDTQGRYMCIDNQGLVLFNYDKPLLQPEKKDAKGTIIQPALYGASLENTKRFQLFIQYTIDKTAKTAKSSSVSSSSTLFS